MPNRDFAEDKQGLGGRAMSPPMTGKKPGPKGSMNEKPGFPTFGAPGKTGPDRSAGVKKAKVYPNSDGL